MLNEVVGNYKILDKIGEGGMGEVFKAIDVMLEREVAIKLLRPELAGKSEIVARFRKEAVVLAKLNHPNIATLYNFVHHGDRY
ncbi:MAG: serine/threonine protein kinase, partial [Gammaproteobacteria bacterium]